MHSAIFYLTNDLFKFRNVLKNSGKTIHEFFDSDGLYEKAEERMPESDWFILNTVTCPDWHRGSWMSQDYFDSILGRALKMKKVRGVDFFTEKDEGEDLSVYDSYVMDFTQSLFDRIYGVPEAPSEIVENFFAIVKNAFWKKSKNTVESLERYINNDYTRFVLVCFEDGGSDAYLDVFNTKQLFRWTFESLKNRQSSDIRYYLLNSIEGDLHF